MRLLSASHSEGVLILRALLPLVLTAEPLMFALLSEGDLAGLLALLIGGRLRRFLDVLWCGSVLALLLDLFALLSLQLLPDHHV